jgi:hypothetical protein
MFGSKFSLPPRLFLLGLMLSSDAFAQTYSIRGMVVDENKSPLPGVLVRLVDLADSSKSFVTSTNLDGSFSLQNLPSHIYRLELTAVGRKDFHMIVEKGGTTTNVGSLSMKDSAIPLHGVTVEGRVPSAIQNGDTTEFQAVAVKMNRDATMEDLLTKLPGVVVSNGTVTVGGETVQRVLVDGTPYYGDDPTVAIRNLPAEVIDKIQVFDQMSDQAQFTGFDDGQSVKAINVVTKRNRGNLNFGKFTAGYGDDNGRYDAAANTNMFDGDSRISLLGSSNNVNQQDFSTQDILGVISTNSQSRTPGAGAGSGGNGQRRANPFGRSGGISSNNQLVGQQPGINNTSILGANASDSLAENLFAQGSYFFNRVGNQNDQLDHRQNLLGGDSISLYNQTSNVSSTNYNNRISSRIDYAADPSNKLTILPVLYFQSNRANNLLDATSAQSDTVTNTNTVNNGYNLTGHAVYRHAFDLPGRTISLDFGAGANQKQTNRLLSAADQYYGTGAVPNDSLSQKSNYLSNAETASGNFIYTEPTDVNARVELLYNSSFTHSTAYQNTYNFDPFTDAYTNFYAPLSDSYSDNYMTQKVGIGYLWRSISTTQGGYSQSSPGWNIMANLSYQYAELNGDDSTSTNMSIMKRFWDFLPSALINYTTADHRNLRIFYRTSTTAPAVTQLQPVINNSNPLLLTTGNPDLSESYSQSLLARYNLTAPGRAESMFLLLSATYTQDYVANAAIIPSRDTVLSNGTTLAPGAQLAYPVNLDGYWNARSFFTYGLPFDLISSALNLNAGVTYNRTPGMLNNVVSDANTIGPSAGFVIGSNISQDFDFTVSYMGNYNFAMNSQQVTESGNYYSHTASLKWVWEFWNGIVMNNQLSSQVTSGLAQGYDQNILLWNFSFAKKFFAKESGQLQVSVNDLLGQNKSVSRTVTDAYIDDLQNEVLTRYILVTFSYTMR